MRGWCVVGGVLLWVAAAAAAAAGEDTHEHGPASGRVCSPQSGHEIVRCASRGPMQTCRSTAPICALRLLRSEKGGGVCDEHRTFGRVSDHELYVRGGCRGLFEVTPFASVGTNDTTARGTNAHHQQSPNTQASKPSLTQTALPHGSTAPQAQRTAPAADAKSQPHPQGAGVGVGVGASESAGVGKGGKARGEERGEERAGIGGSTPSVQMHATVPGEPKPLTNTVVPSDAMLIQSMDPSKRSTPPVSGLDYSWDTKADKLTCSTEKAQRFRIREALSGTETSISFESVRFPEHFVHIMTDDSPPVLRFHKSPGTLLFNTSASFAKDTPGLGGLGTVTFRSERIPTLFLVLNTTTHEVVLAEKQHTDLFNELASWVVEAPDLALRRPSNQSSTVMEEGGIFVASRANDGNSSALYDPEHCSKTKAEDGAYWMVDLGGPCTVWAARVRAPKGCAECAANLKASVLKVGDVPNDPKAATKCGDILVEVSAGKSVRMECPEPVKGRYAFIAMASTGSVSLCEAKIFGSCEAAVELLQTTEDFTGSTAIESTIPPPVRFQSASDITLSACMHSLTRCSGEEWNGAGTCALVHGAVTQPTAGEGVQEFGLAWGNGVLMFGLASPVVTVTSSSSVDLADGNAHHVAGVYDSSAGMAKLFVDGRKVAQKDFASPGPMLPDTLVAGQFTHGSGGYTGHLSNVRAYRGAIADDQVVDLGSTCDSGCVQRDVTLSFHHKTGCAASEPVGVLSLGPCTNSTWVAHHLSFSRLHIVFGSHHDPHRKRKERMRVLVDGTEEGVYYNDNCNTRINGRPCSYLISVPQALHTVVVEGGPARPNMTHPVIGQIAAIECEDDENLGTLKMSARPLPPMCVVDKVLPRFNVSSGCAASTPDGSLRLGSCDLAMWSAEVAFSKLIVVFESDDSTHRDLTDTVDIVVDGEVMKTFENDGCNRLLNKRACEVVIGGDFKNATHQVEVVARSNLKRAKLHGRVGVINAMICQTKEEEAAKSRHHAASVALPTTGHTTTTSPPLALSQAALTAGGSLTDVGSLVQEVIDLWTGLVATLFRALGCAEETEAQQRDEAGSWTPMHTVLLQRDMGDDLISKYGFADQYKTPEPPTTESRCAELMSRHRTLTSMIQTHTVHHNSHDHDHGHGHDTALLELGSWESAQFTPADHIDKVKRILVLQMDAEELMKLIKEQVDSYEEMMSS